LASIGELIGFSGEVGAFLVGMTLASSDYKDAISGRLVSLRDFLLLFFFVHLGTNVDLALIGEQVVASIYLSSFALIGNPIIVLIIMGVMGYRKRTAFLAGLTVAQISEFSLIFAGLGLAVGNINNKIVRLITSVGLVTIGLSSYLILYSHQIFDWISPVLNIFERNKNFTEEDDSLLHKSKKYNVIIISLGRFGNRLVEMLDEHPKINFLGIDFDPSVIQEWKHKGRDVFYGDLEDPELLEHIPYQNDQLIISTIPDKELSCRLTNCFRRTGYNGQLFVIAVTSKDHHELSKYEVDNTLQPHQMAASDFHNSYLKNKLE
jgi:hypothetical protein